MDRAVDPTEDAPKTSRRELIRRGSLAAPVIAAGGATGLARDAALASAAPSPTQDRKVLNFALLLEYLQEAFYSEALKRGALKGEVRRFAEVVAGHERAHVAFLHKALGSHARPRPSFSFAEATRHERSFLDAAVLLENTTVLAYNGQAANLTKPALAAAAEIVSVEGRHAGWVSDLARRPPAPRAADVGETAADAVRALKAGGLLK